jgi:hypothetical protein
MGKRDDGSVDRFAGRARPEAEVERNLVKNPCTRMVSAHRLRTVRNSDLLPVLEKAPSSSVARRPPSSPPAAATPP